MLLLIENSLFRSITFIEAVNEVLVATPSMPKSPPSIFIDPRDNHVIASLRNQDSMIKINRSTGEIEWVLGGVHDQFNLSTDQMPSKQHHATVTEAGNLILYDNENENENEQTRITYSYINRISLT